MEPLFLPTLVLFPDTFASSTMDIMGQITLAFSNPLTMIIGVMLGLIAVVVLVRVLIRH